jgi:hypothetical protein
MGCSFTTPSAKRLRTVCFRISLQHVVSHSFHRHWEMSIPSSCLLRSISTGQGTLTGFRLKEKMRCHQPGSSSARETTRGPTSMLVCSLAQSPSPRPGILQAVWMPDSMRMIWSHWTFCRRRPFVSQVTGVVATCVCSCSSWRTKLGWRCMSVGSRPLWQSRSPLKQPWACGAEVQQPPFHDSFSSPRVE